MLWWQGDRPCPASIPVCCVTILTSVPRNLPVASAAGPRRRVAAHWRGCGLWLGFQFGRLSCSQMLNVWPSPRPHFTPFLCTLASSATYYQAIGQIDKRRGAFVWTGTDSCTGAKCRVAWPVVCRPTDLGGLGVTDLMVLWLHTQALVGLVVTQSRNVAGRVYLHDSRSVSLLCVLRACLVFGGDRHVRTSRSGPTTGRRSDRCTNTHQLYTQQPCTAPYATKARRGMSPDDTCTMWLPSRLRTCTVSRPAAAITRPLRLEVVIESVRLSLCIESASATPYTTTARRETSPIWLPCVWELLQSVVLQPSQSVMYQIC